MANVSAGMNDASSIRLASIKTASPLPAYSLINQDTGGQPSPERGCTMDYEIVDTPTPRARYGELMEIFKAVLALPEGKSLLVPSLSAGQEHALRAYSNNKGFAAHFRRTPEGRYFWVTKRVNGNGAKAEAP